MSASAAGTQGTRRAFVGRRTAGGCRGSTTEGRRVTADGSRGQFAAVDRSTGSVVVKTSLWPYDDPWADRHFRDLGYLGLHALLDTTDAARTTPLPPQHDPAERHRP